MYCTLPGSGRSAEVILPVLRCLAISYPAFPKKGKAMQPKHIYDRSKSRAMAWALQQPNGLRCTICGATGPTLTLADIDLLHTRFVARCHQHIETAPRILSVYALVLEKRQESAVLQDAKRSGGTT
jgi:hypothetical protein